MMTATLRNWGGSIALPLPKKLLALAAMNAGDAVKLDLQGGKITIEAAPPQYTLAQLMQEHKALKLPRDDAWLDFPALPSEQV